MKSNGKLKPGDWVEVRSKNEILSTLDSTGRLEGMPFMPEMFKFCGKKFQVYKSAHKSCDYTKPYPYHSRHLERTVHLETRCDGEAHGGCQAGCLIFWKEAWLKPAARDPITISGTTPPRDADRSLDSNSSTPCCESDVESFTQIPHPQDGIPRYRCQTTELPGASTPLAWWDIRQYVEDYVSGNIKLRRLAGGFVYSLYYHLSQAGIGLGRPMRWFYNKFHTLWGGTAFPRNPGLIAEGKPTPSVQLNLQPGELVRVKSQQQILETVNASNVNRGMYWDAELVPYCAGTYRVLKSVTKIIDEQSGKMLEMKNPCIILDSVICQGRYSSCRMFCPRSMYPYWREIWLERVAPAVPGVHSAK